MTKTYIKKNGEISTYHTCTRNSNPKCCKTRMNSLKASINSHPETIGYMCKVCNNYVITKKLNEDGPKPYPVPQVYIRLKTIKNIGRP